MKMYETDKANTCGKYTHMDRLNSGSFGNVLSFIFFKFDRIYSVCCIQKKQLNYLYRCNDEICFAFYSAHTFLFLPLRLNQTASVIAVRPPFLSVIHVFACTVFIYWRFGIPICLLAICFPLFFFTLFLFICAMCIYSWRISNAWNGKRSKKKHSSHISSHIFRIYLKQVIHTK